MVNGSIFEWYISGPISNLLTTEYLISNLLSRIVFAESYAKID